MTEPHGHFNDELAIVNTRQFVSLFVCSFDDRNFQFPHMTSRNPSHMTISFYQVILFLLPQHERLKNSHLSGRLNLHYSEKAHCSTTIKSFVTQLLRQVQPPFATLILSLR